MKFTFSEIFLIYLFLIFNIINCQLKRQPIFKCEHDDYDEKHPLPTREIKQKESFKRRIDGNESPKFEDFKIYLDFENLEKDMETYNLTHQKDFFENSMIKAVETLTALLKVKPLKVGDGKKGYNMKSEDFKSINITYYNKSVFGDEAIDEGKTFQSQGIHLAIFGTFTQLTESTLATASCRVFQTDDGQPYVGVVKINKDIDYSKPNSDVYFESILVHEFTHILGFSKHFFETYSHNIFWELDNDKVNRTYLNGPKLMQVAKKYFNCDSLKGVELENQGGSGTAGSHWESRILLGEYMNGYAYTEEQVISEFTLAVLEDSGYYQANYYTGGLMRYGKHKGCDFLTERCVNSEHKINPYFENEFYDTISSVDNIESSCSSGRQSRTYNAWWQNYPIPKLYQYFENENVTGYEPADFCPVPLKFQDEEDKSYFVGHCSIKGSGFYGSMLKYYKNYDPTSANTQKETGETFSDHSYCYLSSVSKNKVISNVVRANCYETFCSKRSLTIKIFDDYVVCPRSGGKIKVEGYEGYLLCPDYNLVCSGTEVCNNIFDCVDKKSEINEESYNYDYNIKTSQNIVKANKEEFENELNYELSENGKCPQYCKQCKRNGVCIKCYDNYLKKLETDKSVGCYETINIDDGYFQNIEGIFIKCIENCIACEDLKTCRTCKDNLIFSDNKCIEPPKELKIIDNCNQYDDKTGLCKKCKYGFAFNQTDKGSCHNIEKEFRSYYSKDKEITFFPCSSINENCTECFYDPKEFRAKCTKCKDDFVLLNKGNGQCKTKEEIIENPKYYLIDDANAGVCSKEIENCLSCDNATYCLKCSLSYVYDNENNLCVEKSKMKEENSPSSGNEEGNNDNSGIGSGSGDSTEKTETKRKKVKKSKNGSNYFSIWNIILLEIIYVIFL